MRILILNPILYTVEQGAIHRVSSIKDCMIYNLALAFRQLGHDVTLVAASIFEPAEAEQYDVEVLFFPCRLSSIFRPDLLPLQPGLYTWLRREHSRFDQILSSEAFSFTSLFAAIIAPTKTVVWQELNRHNRKWATLPSRCWYAIVVRFAMSRVKTVVPRSVSARRFIRRYAKQTSDVIVDHGVNIDCFTASTQKRDQFIIVARLVKGKNIDILLHRFARFVQQPNYSHFTLHIAGEGEERHTLEALVLQLGVATQVRFLGQLPHTTLSREVAQSRACLIHTSKDLNMVSIPESIAVGTPIICNTLPALAPFITENRIGRINDNWGVEEMNDVVERNETYVARCLALRPHLSTLAKAKQLCRL